MDEIINLVFNRETISYVIFGVLTTVVSILSYEIIKRAISRGKTPSQLTINIATVGSWVLAVAFAFVTNKLFVFGSSSLSFDIVIKEASLFVGARLLSLGFEVLWMNITTGVLKWNDSFCKIAAQFVIVVMNYIFSKLFIFV
ncbi:MAG: GtrA family protein [Lachnospirales bacterium]